jgi:hypothetical protein
MLPDHRQLSVTNSVPVFACDLVTSTSLPSLPVKHITNECLPISTDTRSPTSLSTRGKQVYPRTAERRFLGSHLGYLGITSELPILPTVLSRLCP